MKILCLHPYALASIPRKFFYLSLKYKKLHSQSPLSINLLRAKEPFLFPVDGKLEKQDNLESLQQVAIFVADDEDENLVVVVIVIVLIFSILPSSLPTFPRSAPVKLQ